MSITFVPIDNGEFISGVSKSVIQNRSAAETAKDPLVRQRADRASEDADGEKIMLQIDREGETVGTMIISIMANLQEQAFKTTAPYHTLDDSIGEVLRRVMPMSSLVGGFPFSSSGYNDHLIIGL